MTEQEFFSRLSVKLNDEQKSAVTSVDGPVLLLAVPGSGKTTALVTRLGYMIYVKGIAPESILTVTYTISATGDMKTRFTSYFNEAYAKKLEFRTINGICSKIISYYGKVLGRDPFNLLEDEKQSASIVSNIYKEVVKDFPTESDIKGIKSAFTFIKNMQLTDAEIEDLSEELELDLKTIYEKYNKYLIDNRLMDYDDQMVYAYKMLKGNPRILEYFQNKYRYICVDEAQDTSKIQHQIVALLADKSKNIFMVGDEDQSIYAFRAAYPKALLDFDRVYPNAKILKLEKNYRSNANIVKAADGFIQKNTQRHEKHMTAMRPAGSSIEYIELDQRYKQYDVLVDVARKCKTQTAVLYRNNECAIPLIDRLDRKGIDFRLKNTDTTFFSNRVVLDVKKVLQFSLNPCDADLFMDIYYKVTSYLSKEEAKAAVQLSSMGHMSILEAALSLNIDSYKKSSIKGLRTNLNIMRSGDPGNAIFRVLEPMGYSEYLRKKNMDDGKVALLKSIASKEKSIASFLDRLTELETIIKEKKNNIGCNFILSTIHSSKGLEYDQVYILDVIDGILPEKLPPVTVQMTEEEQNKYEEERRLFYVGVTRAKNDLKIFKIKGECYFVNQLIDAPKPKIESPNPIEVKYSGMHPFVVGMRVNHRAYGPGTVVNVDGKIVRIRYDKGNTNSLDATIVLKNGLLWPV